MQCTNNIGSAFGRQFLLVDNQEEAVLLLANNSALSGGLIGQPYHSMRPHRTAKSLDGYGSRLFCEHFVFHQRVRFMRKQNAAKVGMRLQPCRKISLRYQ